MAAQAGKQQGSGSAACSFEFCRGTGTRLWPDHEHHQTLADVAAAVEVPGEDAGLPVCDQHHNLLTGMLDAAADALLVRR